MKEFNNLEEMEKYFNKETNTYDFIEDGIRLDIKINFNLDINARDINAWNIKAWDINAGDINAWDINARDIKAWDIDARDIKAWDIKAGDINAWDINAWDINAGDINARDINARDINAWNIKAWDINAGDISFYAACTSYNSIYCTKCEGRREHAVINTLDGDIYYKEK